MTHPAVMSGFVLVLLYMKGPLENLIGNLPIISRAAWGRTTLIATHSPAVAALADRVVTL